ncbi:MAG: DUF3833 domain-containing protein [Burkholderiales bacterium]|nr:DUF3833 domain-containing protein [Burkholderiales bacterium]
MNLNKSLRNAHARPLLPPLGWLQARVVAGSRYFSSALLSLLVLAGCATPGVDSYRAEKPLLDLRDYFSGSVDGWGMVQDRSGKQLRRFHVVIVCTWNGDTGTLDESFVWSDGKKEKRVWTIVKNGDRYTGTAADVVGSAAGEAAGNTLRWNYVLRLPADQGGYAVDVDDWMYLVDEDTLLNRSSIKKFGIRFGDITIAFRKRKG